MRTICSNGTAKQPVGVIVAHVLLKGERQTLQSSRLLSFWFDPGTTKMLAIKRNRGAKPAPGSVAVVCNCNDSMASRGNVSKSSFQIMATS
jgi:hypothetical protein